MAYALVTPFSVSLERRDRHSALKPWRRELARHAVRPAQSRTLVTHARERTTPLGPKTLDIVLSSGRRPHVRGVTKLPERICAQTYRIAELGRHRNTGTSTERENNRRHLPIGRVKRDG
jgi:hypothetical protein